MTPQWLEEIKAAARAAEQNEEPPLDDRKCASAALTILQGAGIVLAEINCSRLWVGIKREDQRVGLGIIDELLGDYLPAPSGACQCGSKSFWLTPDLDRVCSDCGDIPEDFRTALIEVARNITMEEGQ